MPFLFVKQILNFFDLRTFDAKFCHENLRSFSADYVGLKSKIRRHFYFLDVWNSPLWIEPCTLVEQKLVES